MTPARLLFGDRISTASTLIAKTLDAGVEFPGDVGIELRARAALDLGRGDLVGQSLSVGAVAGHGVVGVGHRDDARHDRHVVTLETEWIAFTVPALVVE